ncbi:MAG: hypothetical protein SH817_13765 [Leptospira sp.]|nr:hypothetical protein [Leptospira sp.]
MRFRSSFISKSLIILFFHIFLISLQSEEIPFQMTLLLDEKNPIIKEYEIEFWNQSDLKNKVETPIQKTVPRGRVVITPPSNANFFRVRAVARLNIRGYWTELNPIKRYPLTPKTKDTTKFEVPKPIVITDTFITLKSENQKEVNYLVSPKILLRDSNESKKEITYVYRINEKPWQNIKNESLVFEKDGEYQLEFYGIDTLGNKEKLNRYNFHIDFTPPNTDYQIIGETFNTRDFKFISGNTFLKLNSIDIGSGIESTFYRFVCDLNTKSNWKKYDTQIPISETTNYGCKDKIYFEYYSVDRLGNTESANYNIILLTN